jgi:hypothetical protein
MQVAEGTDRAYTLATKHGVKVAWGTDVLFDPSVAARQGRMLAAIRRWQSPPRSCPRPPPPMPSCSRCAASATPILVLSASSARAHWPTCSSSAEIPGGPGPTGFARYQPVPDHEGRADQQSDPEA